MPVGRSLEINYFNNWSHGINVLWRCGPKTYYVIKHPFAKFWRHRSYKPPYLFFFMKFFIKYEFFGFSSRREAIISLHNITSVSLWWHDTSGLDAILCSHELECEINVVIARLGPWLRHQWTGVGELKQRRAVLYPYSLHHLTRAFIITHRHPLCKT